MQTFSWWKDPEQVSEPWFYLVTHLSSYFLSFQQLIGFKCFIHDSQGSLAIIWSIMHSADYYDVSYLHSMTSLICFMHSPFICLDLFYKV